MCGIVGVISTSTSGLFSIDVEVFKQLLYVDALRGEDSTGIIYYDNNGSMEIGKEASEPSYFLKDNKILSLLTTASKSGKVLIGHNRKKTQGAITDINAHPFLVNTSTAFVHNGTLFSHKHLAETEVDSEALGIHLSKAAGDKIKLENALSEVYGAYACVWIDQDKETLFILRNEDRPLYYTEITGCIFFASEQEILAAILLRNHKKPEKILSFKQDVLYSISVDNTKKETVFKEEPLTLKKSFTPTKTPTKDQGKDIGGNLEENNLFESKTSKNAFKRFKTKFLNKVISFWISDYWATDISTKRWCLAGESFCLPNFNHAIVSFITGKTEEEMKAFSETFLKGTIYSIEWVPKEQLMKLYLKDLSEHTPNTTLPWTH